MINCEPTSVRTFFKSLNKTKYKTCQHEMVGHNDALKYEIIVLRSIKSLRNDYFDIWEDRDKYNPWMKQLKRE